MKNTEAPKNIDEYLESVPDKFRDALEHIRQLVKSIAPEAEECISYSMPSFRYKGMLVHFAAFEKHCSFFPGGIVDRYKDELKDFKTSKGTIQFTPEKPIPDALLTKIIGMRMLENEEKEALKKKKK